MSTSTQVIDASREGRDRAFAMKYVELGESKNAIREIYKLTRGIDIRTVRRGVYRYLDWARAEYVRLHPEVKQNAD